MSTIKQPVLIFEPAGVKRLGPPVDTRPVWDLRVGPTTVLDLLKAGLGKETDLSFWARPELRGLWPAPSEGFFTREGVLLIAGHQLPLAGAWRRDLAELPAGGRIEAEGEILAARMSGEAARDFLAGIDHGAEIRSPAESALEGPHGPVLRYWWEIAEQAPRCLDWFLNEIDLGAGGFRPSLDHAEEYRARIGASNWSACERIHLHEDLSIGPGAFLDAESGGILLDAGVEVGPGAYIKGPCYLGPGSRLKAHGQLMGGVFTGPECRLAGEISGCQFQGYGNKNHHGFLGNAHVGEWVNLGAGATNSNLKNTYAANIRVEYGGMKLDSHRQFLGCCLGDHAKLGIQARINTGSVLGSFSNWFGSGFPPKHLPAFSWAGDDGLKEYRLEDALVTAERVMERRGRHLDPVLEQVYRGLFESSAELR